MKLRHNILEKAVRKLSVPDDRVVAINDRVEYSGRPLTESWSLDV